jgi:hypothetical protein
MRVILIYVALKIHPQNGISSYEKEISYSAEKTAAD